MVVTSFAETTTLDRVTITGGHKNRERHEDERLVDHEGIPMSGADCTFPYWQEAHVVSDSSTNEVFDGNDGGLYPFFISRTDNTVSAEYKVFQSIDFNPPTCRNCTYRHGPGGDQITVRYGTSELSLSAGSIEIPVYPFDIAYLPRITRMYGELCSLTPPDPKVPSGQRKDTAEGSYIVTLSCRPNETEETVSHLHVETIVRITALAPPTEQELFLNGVVPSYVENTYNFDNMDGSYDWNGILKWDIPLFKKCGSIVTLAPTTSAYAYVRFSAVQAVLDTCKPIMD